jgi:hypothetical protein
MRNSARIALLVALMTVAAQFSFGSALADDHDRNSWGDRDHLGDRDHGVHGAPGPIAGAGLPILAVGYGFYWLVRRRRKA